METGALGAKPLPVTVTCVPTVPVIGVMLILGLTVTVAVLVWPLWSVALIVCVPPFTAGITKLTVLIAPLRSLVAEEGLTVRAAPSMVKVICCVGEKPVPLTTTLSPTPPLAGLTLIFGAIVKVVMA